MAMAEVWSGAWSRENAVCEACGWDGRGEGGLIFFATDNTDVTDISQMRFWLTLIDLLTLALKHAHFGKTLLLIKNTFYYRRRISPSGTPKGSLMRIKNKSKASKAGCERKCAAGGGSSQLINPQEII